MYWGYQQQTSHDTGSMCSFCNIPLPEHLSPTPISILSTLFCSKNTFFIMTELPPPKICHILLENENMQNIQF
jgi:hypothetical protein